MLPSKQFSLSIFIIQYAQRESHKNSEREKKERKKENTLFHRLLSGIALDLKIQIYIHLLESMFISR